MRHFGRIFWSFLILFGINSLWAGDFDEFEDFRRGVVVLSIYKNIEINIPLEGALRSDNSDIDEFMDQIGATWIERKYPYCLPPKTPEGDLTGIYTLYFPESLSPAQVARDLQLLTSVKYAEQWHVYRTCLDHDDPNRNRQYYLNLTEANAAHDLSTGNPETVVAIVDTGTDMDHSDLEGNIWLNPGEDLNGNGEIDDNERNNRDDDGNGVRDDFHGWDYYSGDNDPNDISGHGTHCSGDASAITNNNRGVASIGYSCSIMPIRAGTGGVITRGYDGIEYAVRSGAHVISLSWGGPQRQNAADAVIQYAYDNDVISIAAAGNDDSDRNFYPAAYDNVISVAATDNRDRKANFSNFGEWIDISAPGVSIYSTTRGGGYGNMSGTSMSCPIVAGAAVLIRAAYPRMTVDDVVEILLEGADDVGLENMGSGRLNIYESLLLGVSPELSLDELEIVYDDNEDQHIDPGETVSIAFTLSNSIDGIPVENIVLTLFSLDPKIAVSVDTAHFPDLEPGESFSNVENPFQIVVEEDVTPYTTWLEVLVSVEPSDANFQQTFEIIVGHPSILVVDDDPSEDGFAAQAIYKAIERNDMGWAHWVSRIDFYPDLVTLLSYDMVIWITGNTENPLDGLDRFQIQSALEDSANIWLIGNRIGDDEANHSLLRQYFGAEHDEDSVPGMFAKGISDYFPLEESVDMMLFNAGFEDNYDGRTSPSSMTATRGGVPLLNYTNRDEELGVAAVYNVLNHGRTEARSIYMGFAFEAVRDNIGNFTPKDRVVEALLDWFTGELTGAPDLSVILPETYSLAPAFPNPFNNSLIINFRLPNRSFYQVSIVDLVGREIARLSSGISTTDMNSVVWMPNANISSGNYFVRLTSPGKASLQQKIILLK